jgi:hypothetical protein
VADLEVSRTVAMVVARCRLMVALFTTEPVTDMTLSMTVQRVDVVCGVTGAAAAQGNIHHHESVKQPPTFGVAQQGRQGL